MTATSVHRLTGLEPDNLLAFLALLGLLRALEAADRETDAGGKFSPRAAWDLDRPPLRPLLVLRREATEQDILSAAARGLEILVAAHDFDGRKDLDYKVDESRRILESAAREASARSRDRADLVTALLADGAVKDEKTQVVQPTPFCLLFGQGHQHFLERLAAVPRVQAPPPRDRGRAKITVTAEQCLSEALFQEWHRNDPTFSFRWDPDEDVRYALMAGDPTDPAYKQGTQHGANRLASIGLATLTVSPTKHAAGSVRASVIGGSFSRGSFSFAWPVWRDPASLRAIRALLAHPALRQPGGLEHLGVAQVFIAERILVGKFMNFARARTLESWRS